MFITESEKLNGVSKFEAGVNSNQAGFTIHHFKSYRIPVAFVEDTVTHSKNRILRSLSVKPDQLIQCLAGDIMVVVVDLIPNSGSFGEHERFELSNPQESLYVPRGYATGYVVTSKSATVYQKFSEYDHYRDEVPLKWDDPDFGFDWGIPNPIVTKRDAEGLTMRQYYEEIMGYDGEDIYGDEEDMPEPDKDTPSEKPEIIDDES